LIEGNIQHPARELMWGSPGTLLAALFMHQQTGQERFAELFRRTAAVLSSQLEWSEAYGCRYWTQQLYGQVSTYMDAVHGFAGTALPLIRGRHLLAADDWARWQECIATSVRRSATLEEAEDRETAHVNWIPWLVLDASQRERWNAQPRWLVQYCHGSPGFVINLADFPGAELDALLLGAGETTWAAGPLKKGSNLCHGTGGNGYAFLKLYRRTGDARWLQRARAFAMHGIRQTEAQAAQYGRMRYSLWTGDAGFAVYLWDCIRGTAAFPTLDVF
jgi:Lanthionine synthetase C-like protein